ncbi:MAG: nucleotidyltransferase domain-containing protein [Propionibacteriaceae bacterium]|nr:nucleotidyltransferase domain-containing protein [Propionibacteriaceae bacterium]
MIPSSLDPTVVAEIDRRLDSVEQEYAVRVPWAIESGSRAWGFPSPDSDYDCRFIFVRDRDAYLSLWTPRDVIETPLDAVFDVNGWDVAKTIRLLAKGNATAVEWLRSPIVYRGDRDFHDGLLALADEIVERDAVARHYRHVALQQAGKSTPSLKRFFYVLRPTVALRWLRIHPGSAIPPMDLPTLLAESDVPRDVLDASQELIALKAKTHELGAGEPPEVLVRFAEKEIDAAAEFETFHPTKNPATVRALADEFFREQVR